MERMHRDSLPLFPLVGLSLFAIASFTWAERAPTPLKIALLPLIEGNSTAKTLKISPRETENLRAQLVNRKELSLLAERDVIRLLRRSAAARANLESPEAAVLLGKELGADFVLVGRAARYGIKDVVATYFDVRIMDGRTGGLVGWCCERADLIREASMTVSSPATEQMERLGSYITVCIRDSRGTAGTLSQRAPVVVFPFEDSTEDTYGEAVARMFATDLMNRCPYRVLPLPRTVPDLDRAGLVKWAKELSAKYVFFGEIVVSPDSLNELRATMLPVDTGKAAHACAETFASDMDLRVASANLAQRFTPGGHRILWRRYGGAKLYSSPVLAEGKLLVAVEGPAITALSPVDGRNLWSFAPAALAKGGGSFMTPCLLGENLYTQPATGVSVVITDVKTGTGFVTGSLRRKGYAALDRRLASDGERLFLSYGDFGAAALDAEGQAIWKYSGRSALMLGHGFTASGDLIAGSRNGKVSALEKADGKALWHRRLSDRLWAAPLVSGERVYAGCEDGRRYRLSAEDGTVKWVHDGKGRSLAVAAADENKVYFGSDDGKVACLEADSGEPSWETSLGGAPQGALELYQGVLYVPSADGFLYCLDAGEGAVLWRTDLRDALHSAPLVVATETLLADPDVDPPKWMDLYDHVVFVNSTDGYTYALGGSVSK